MKSINIPDFPPELSLMLTCLETRPDQEKLVSQCRQVTHWNQFTDWWIGYHRTLPQVYTSLKKYAWPEVPDQIRKHLKTQHDHNVRRSITNAVALVNLARLLSENNIPFLAFKGPTLALHLYDNLHLRQAGDLDLLIEPSQMQRAETVLKSADYEQNKPGFELSPKQRKVYQRIFHHFIFSSPDRSARIEVHWRLTFNRFLLPLATDQLFEKSQQQIISGHPVPMLSDADMALYLFAHGANHAWYRLCWLHDIVTFMAQTNHNWTGTLARASEMGLARPVLQGALLAHHLLKCPIPDTLAKQATQDSKITWMSRLVIDRLVKQYDVRNPTVRENVRSNVFYLFYLRRNLAYKLSTLHNQSLNPVDDWSTVQLPDRLFPLYYLLRFPLWCIRKLRNQQDI